MNLFEFIAILAVVGGLAYGCTQALDEGLWEALLGALRSAGIAYLWFVAFMAALLSILSLGLLYRPYFPRCRNGKCGQSDYRYLYLEESPAGRDKALEEAKGGKLVRCKCGTLYLQCGLERRFYEVREDRTLVPYMRFSPLGRWRPDGNAGATSSP